MSNERDDGFDATRPTLIVKYGGATRQYRALDRAVLIVGRSAGSDVGLEAPDVAPVHRVLVRALDGWHVRDCTGRGGTRLNGRSVQDAALNDEDVLQIGSFSFTLHLPPEERPFQESGSANALRSRRAERSRHHLTRLALRLRNQLAEQSEAAAERADQQPADRPEERNGQAEEGRALQRDMDARLIELKQAARQIAEDNLALTERRGQIEAEQEEKRAEIAAARAALEEDRRESIRELEIRGRETTCFAGYLRRLRQRLNEHEESLTNRWEEWLREQQEASVAEARQNEKIAHEEALLREQRAEVVRLMGEMRQMRRQPDPAAEALRSENEMLRRDLAAALEAAKAASVLPEPAPIETGRPGGVASLNRIETELDDGRRILDDQIRCLQGRFAEFERSASEAEGHIHRERTRMMREREELERLRGELSPDGGPSSSSDTLADAPSPLHKRSESADAEAPRAPSRASALTE